MPEKKTNLPTGVNWSYIVGQDAGTFRIVETKNFLEFCREKHPEFDELVDSFDTKAAPEELYLLMMLAGEDSRWVIDPESVKRQLLHHQPKEKT